ncbi:hypothetical protein T265_14661, partial [Opisthorchis viverrini]
MVAALAEDLVRFIAEVTMQKLKQIVLPDIDPKIWIRYMDDKFVIIKRSELQMPVALSVDEYRTPPFYSFDTALLQSKPHVNPGEPCRVYHALASSLSWIYITGGESEDGEIIDQAAPDPPAAAAAAAAAAACKAAVEPVIPAAMPGLSCNAAAFNEEIPIGEACRRASS